MNSRGLIVPIFIKIWKFKREKKLKGNLLEMQVQISKKVGRAHKEVKCIVSLTQISGFRAEIDAASVPTWKPPNGSEFTV